MLNFVFNILFKKKKRRKKSCTVLMDEGPSPFGGSLPVFALQVRLLEDDKCATSVTSFCDSISSSLLVVLFKEIQEEYW